MTQPASDWCAEARAKLARMEALIAQGRGDALVPGGGCTEPGGGIVPVTHTARALADLLRKQIALCTAPPPFGQPAGHVGGSYDWWWYNFGRTAGMPYAPTIMRNGRPVAGFSLGGPPVLSECAKRKIMDIESRHALGEPPRPSECACKKVLGISDNITAPATGRRVVGFADPDLAMMQVPGGPSVMMAFVGGAAAAATGWLLEEVWSAVRGRKVREYEP